MYFFVLAVLVLLSCTIIFRLRKYNVIRKIPGPTWLDMFKLFFLKATNKDIHRFLVTLPEKYGPVVKLWLKPFVPALLVADPTYFEHILRSKEHLDKTSMYKLFKNTAGNGLTTNQNVKQWKSDRKMLNDVFSHKSVSHYSLKFKHQLDKLGSVLKSHENRVMEVQFLMHHYTIHIIIEYLTQERMNEETATQLTKALDIYLEVLMDRAYSIYKSSDTLFRFTKGYKVWVASASIIHNIISNILQTQIELRKNKSQKTGEKNFFDLLLESELSQDSILDQVKTFIMAGFETSANIISFALFEIAKRPDIQENMFQEYLSIVGPNEESTVTYSDLQNMTYTDAVLKETMRMYPGIPLIQRTLKSPATIDGVTIPAGIDIIFSIQSLHNLNFPRPTEFEPDRFSPENMSNIDPYIYAPFSIGPRDCIGRRIAMVEMKYMISYIVRHFTLHSVQPEHQLDVVGEFTLKSKNGVPIIFKIRK